MLTVEDFDQRVLLEYVNDDTKRIPSVAVGKAGYYTYIKVKPRRHIGVFTSIGAGIVGWSLCCSRDRFDKERGIHIALSRAVDAAELSPEERVLYYENVPNSIRGQFEDMLDRSFNYYTPRY